MPRLRKGPNSQPKAGSGPLILDVEHQGAIVSIQCGDGTQDLAWLATQAEKQFSFTAAPLQVSSSVGGFGDHIKHFVSLMCCVSIIETDDIFAIQPQRLHFKAINSGSIASTYHSTLYRTIRTDKSCTCAISIFRERICCCMVVAIFSSKNDSHSVNT